MKNHRKKSFVSSVILLTLLTAAPALSAEPVSALLKKSRSLISNNKFDRAHTLLLKAKQQEPQNADIDLARARLYNWLQDYDKASNIINEMPLDKQNISESLALKGYIAYNQSQFKEAVSFFKSALAKAPNDVETTRALNRAKKALHAPKQKRWQINFGNQVSEFARQGRPNWSETSLRLTHFAADREWSLFSAVHTYNRNNNNDTMIHFGGSYRFTKDTAGYAWTAITPEADYRPEWSLAAGGQTVLDKSIMPVSALLDTKFELYTLTNSITFKPGLRIDPADGWGLSSHFITVMTKDGYPLYGWDARIDGIAFDTVRFFAGFANAPEYEEGSTVGTKTIFGGFGFDVNSDLGLQLSYARDDREQSYIRHVYYVGTSYRF